MSTTLTPLLSELRFTVTEAANICEMDSQVLRNWCGVGRIVPVIRGHRGNKSHHYFSVAQVMGVTIAESMLREGWCSRRRAIQVIEAIAGMDEDTVREWLKIDADDRTEERAAIYHSGHPLFAPNESIPTLPGLKQATREMARRLYRVRQAVVARLAGRALRFNKR